MRQWNESSYLVLPIIRSPARRVPVEHPLKDLSDVASDETGVCSVLRDGVMGSKLSGKKE